MISYLSGTPSLGYRAAQTWPVLIKIAYNRQTTTYKQIADIWGYKGSDILGRQKGHIY